MVAQPPSIATTQRVPVVLRYAVTGDLRYLSHHDELRMLTRAVVRAQWPLAYSHGFNPLARVRIPLPRSVGTAAAEQVALVDLTAPRTAEELHASLAAQMPADCRLHEVLRPAARFTPHPQRVEYAVTLTPTEVGPVAERCAAVLAAETLMIERGFGPGRRPQPVDLRPLITDLRLAGTELHLTLQHVQQRAARPAEVLTVLGLAAAECAQRVCRRAIQWDIELSGPADGAPAETRN